MHHTWWVTNTRLLWDDILLYIDVCAHDYFPIILIGQHAHALELLSAKLMEGATALDVGSGSGYLTACFARMVSSLLVNYWTHTSDFSKVSATAAFILCAQTGPTGRVVGVEHISQLVEMSIRNVQADDPELLTSGRIRLVGMCCLF